jgi:hypothetical protein
VEAGASKDDADVRVRIGEVLLTRAVRGWR